MGNQPSFPSEGAFEPSSDSSPVVEEQDCSQLNTFDSDVSPVLSSTMSAPGSTSKPIPTPSANVCHLDLESNCLKYSTFSENLGAKLLEEEPTDSCCISFDATEKVNVLESSFDSSNSSIINIISEQSIESIPEVIEQSIKCPEALLLECIDQMQGLLKSISFEPENTQSVSDKTLKSLNELHKAIGICTHHWYTFQHKNENKSSRMKSCCTDLSTNSTLIPSFVKECKKRDAINANETTGVHEESSLTKGADDSSINSKSILEEQSLKILDTAFHIHKIPSMDFTSDKYQRSSSAINSDVVSTSALLTIGKTSVDNLSRIVQDQRQIACGDNDEQNSNNEDNECMFVAEKVSVQPFLLRSLTALQTTAGVNTLLIDAEGSNGAFCPLYTDSQQQMFDDNKVNRQLKFSSAIKEKVLSVGSNPNAFQLTEGVTLERPTVRYPICLNDIMNHESSAATLGKAVIRNALAFEKYAMLFRRALDDDVLTASVGRALCRNALLFESLTCSVNIDEQCQSQQQHQVTNPTVVVSKGSEQDRVFASIQLHSNRNKENENPIVEHLFKQSASKRKLGTLEEETRRTKCLVLSQKSTVEMKASNNTHAWNGVHIAKQGRKAKTHTPNNNSTRIVSTSKSKTAMKKATLQEIMINGPAREAEEVRLSQNENNILDYDTLKDNETKKERWTVIEKNNEDMLELEDSEEENVNSPLELPLNLRSKLNELQSPLRSTTDTESIQTVKTDYALVEDSMASSSKQLDVLRGIYYFTNEYIFCSICHTNMFNHLRVLDHVNGNVHKTNLINCTKTAPAIMSVSATLQSIWDQIDTSLGRKLFCKLVKFENDTLACILCDVAVSGCLNVIAHVSGEEHQAKLLDKIYAKTSKVETSMAVHRKISWPDGLSFSLSDVSLSESEGSIVEWLPASSPTRSATLESDLSGIYYFAKNYVFCSICNINMFNSSIVLGHLHAKSHLANIKLQKQIQSNNQVVDNETKLNRIWNQIERTLGGTLFHTVLCVDKNTNFFCDLCNMHIIISGHLNILDHVCGKKHSKEFFKHVLMPGCKRV